MFRRTRFLAASLLALTLCAGPVTAWADDGQAPPPAASEQTEAPSSPHLEDPGANFDAQSIADDDGIDASAVVDMQLTASASPTLSFSSWRAPKSCENNDGWSHGAQGFEDSLRIDGSDGSVAYCLDPALSAPGGDAIGYENPESPTLRVFALLYFGYPNTTTIGGISLEPDQARSATQLALWALIGDENMQMDHWHTVSGDYGDAIISAAAALVQTASTFPDEPASESNVNEFFGFSSLTADDSATAEWFSGDLIRFGAFSASALLGPATLNALLSENIPDSAFFGDAAGNRLETLPVGTPFYLYVPRTDLTSSDDAEVTFALDYQQDTEVVWYTSGDLQRVVGSGGMGTFHLNGATGLEWGSCEGVKVADDQSTAIPGTTFALYRQTADGVWSRVAETMTDQMGCYRFEGLPYGSYRIVEEIPAEGYMLPSECGSSDERSIDVTSTGTTTVPPFADREIEIGCEIDKSTIEVTSAAFSSVTDTAPIDNVGVESFAYDIDYRSTSNVAVDEFTVTDPLEAVAEDQVRVVELWTPVSYGDTDGRMNVWYRTNLTDDSVIYSSENAMSDNPFNPRNPSNVQQMSNTGWKLWANDVDCSTQTHLVVADIGLSEGEYITALRFEHGSVEVGFSTDATESWSTNTDGTASAASEAAEKLRPVTYLVIANSGLEPVDAEGNEALIVNSATADAFRDITLHADDTDVVQTRVIDTFSFPSTTRAHGMAKTGDPLSIALVIGALIASAGILVILRRHQRIRQSF